MDIQLVKISHKNHEVHITRKDGTIERFELETSTYFFHDLVHFVVESHLGYKRGFWGMIASGYKPEKLIGKENPDTEELRFIERIVGPVSSVCLGHISEKFFPTTIAHLKYDLPDGFLTVVKNELVKLQNQWKELPFGESLKLVWYE